MKQTGFCGPAVKRWETASRAFFSVSLVVCTCEVKRKGDKTVVFAEDTKRLLSLHQCEEVIRHSLAVKKVVHAQQEVPVGQKVETHVLYKSHQWQLIRLKYACKKNLEGSHF